MAARARQERSVIVFGAMEASLTPLMEDIEARFAGVKVFSLPSVDHPAVRPPHRTGCQRAVADAAHGRGLCRAARRVWTSRWRPRLGPELVR